MHEATTYGEVPFIHDWFSPAYASWSRSMYPRRGGFWFASGCLLLFVILPLIALKAVIFWGVVAVMLVLWILTAVYDMATYRYRLRKAIEFARQEEALD